MNYEDVSLTEEDLNIKNMQIVPIELRDSEVKCEFCEVPCNLDWCCMKEEKNEM